jgi:hypothetical protein
MRSVAVIALILAGTAGCNKANDGAAAGADAAAPQTDLATRPDILFQVFGEREDPRLIPVALLGPRGLEDIVLDAEGWRRFDAQYLRGGTTYTLYHDGRAHGPLTVRRGMWDQEPPLYTLPGCASLVPMASVALPDSAPPGYTVELYATARTVAARADSTLLRLSAESVTAIARRLGAESGAGAEIDAATLDSLDFRAVAIHTGTGARPTVIVSYVDPQGGDEGLGAGNTAHVLAVGDDTAGTGHRLSFSHAVNGDARTAAYRRYVDHLDLTGDGVDEILLEGWRYGGDTQLVVLAWRNGTWREVYTGRSSWCLDARR